MPATSAISCIRAPSLPFREKTSSAASKICRSVSEGVASAPAEGTEVVVFEVIAQTISLRSRTSRPRTLPADPLPPDRGGSRRGSQD